MTSNKNTSSAPAGQQRSLRSLGGHCWQPRVLALTLTALFAPVGGFAQDSTAVEETATLPRISVVGTSGTDEVRQAQRRVQVGPLGERDSVATPYSVSAVSAEQMADDQNFSVQDALRYLPWVQADTVRPQTRGVQGSVIQNSRVDGFNMVSTTNYPTEQFERIEVLNGVAGSLYGPATGSGVFGFTQKRAQEKPRYTNLIYLHDQSIFFTRTTREKARQAIKTTYEHKADIMLQDPIIKISPDAAKKMDRSPDPYNPIELE